MQFSSTILELAIGLACIFVALSLLVSWVNEALATALNLRGKNLSDGIAQMVSDAQIHAELYGHPIIASCRTDPRRLPSYLSSSQFTTALLDVIGAGKMASTNAAAAFTDLQNAVAALNAGALKTALTSILTRAAGNYDAAVGGMESWYDDTMNRVSGVYRRSATIWIFVIGLLLVVALDADAIKFVKVIEWNSATRAGLTAVATAASKESDTASALQHVSSTVFGSFAFGWFGSPSGAPFLETWWQQALGLLATVLAISLGAPFWFDTLKLLMNVRNAGVKPSDSGGS
jgi:hypothetical protein